MMVRFGALLALALLGYFVFPGHTYLQSDTHIYLPMMERLLRPELLRFDIIATHPHLSYTLYDEIACGIKWLTSLDFQPILQVQQFLARVLALIGVYLLATAAGVRPGAALFASGLFSLGATITGPAVLTVEYEPVPRGMALPLLLLAMGLAGHGRMTWAAVAAGVAFLYHPPTVWPVWFVFAFLPQRKKTLPVLAGFVLLLFVASRLQVGEREKQEFFARIPPDLEALQRMRAAYNWVGMWIGQWWGHYLALLAIGLGAWWRIRPFVNSTISRMLVGLPILGALSVPLSYWLLDVNKWIVIPQAQPGRALLWVTACVLLNCGLAAGLAKRKVEAFAWLVVPFALPTALGILDFNWLLAAALAGLACLVLDRPWAAVVIPVAMFAYPYVGGIKNYPNLHTPELNGLSTWAREQTPVDAVFHFADSGLELYPGIFRSRALRAVWVDRKGGGQVNFTYGLAVEWYRRYSATIAKPYAPWDLAEYKKLPADFLVVKASHKRPELTPVYSNSSYFVYRLP